VLCYADHAPERRKVQVERPADYHNFGRSLLVFA